MKGHTKDRKRSEVDKKEGGTNREKKRGGRVKKRCRKKGFWDFPFALLLSLLLFSISSPSLPPSATLLLLSSFSFLGSCGAPGMLATTLQAPPTDLLPFLQL